MASSPTYWLKVAFGLAVTLVALLLFLHLALLLVGLVLLGYLGLRLAEKVMGPGTRIRLDPVILARSLGNWLAMRIAKGGR
ncbi:MAG TPA: hypothetical protein HPP80_06010 [Rhodospirillaceae bacterium]|nr:hypothetical protein [Rhodospirillaceae bacterium]